MKKITKIIIASVVMLLCIAGLVSYFMLNGWKITNKGRMFKVNGKPMKGMQEIEKVTYVFDDKGYLYEGWFDYKDKHYYQDDKGLYKNEREVQGEKYNFEADGNLITGFYTDDEGTLRYRNKNGYFEEGELENDNNNYYINADGTIFTGWKTAMGPYYNEEGHMIYGLQELDKNIYYLDEKGMATTGWLEDEAGLHYFDEAGHQVTGFVTIDGKDYCIGDEGVVVDGLVTVDSDIYYVNTDGSLKTGWYEEKGNKYFFNKDGKASKGFLQGQAFMYYFDDKGVMSTGWIEDKGKTYLFDDNGHMLYGWQDKDKTKVYLTEDGSMATSECEVEGQKYNFEADGTYKKSWVNKVYYIRGYAASGLTNCDGTYYYLNNDGTAGTGGWKTLNNNKYHFEANGQATKGLKKVDNELHFFDDNGRMRVGFVDVGAETYYFDQTGKIRKEGIVKFTTGTYYIKANGAVVKDSIKTANDKTYIFGSDGKACTGWKYLNGNMYYLDKDGVMLVDTEMDGFIIDEKGVVTNWSEKFTPDDKDEFTMYLKACELGNPSGYLILVNKTTKHVGVYYGNGGNCKEVKYFLCTVGAPGSETIEGHFNTGDKFYYFDSHAARLFYATRIRGAYLFHSVLYYQDSSPQRLMDGRLGMALSAGCVRLHLDNAKWIYDNIPRGTDVYIYR